MLSSKQRADLRAQSNDLDTTLMVGKGGVTDSVIAEAENQLTARELVKGIGGRTHVPPGGQRRHL